jgi:hypothetical protein
MDALIGGVRALHILAGTIALFVAPIPMLTAKGGRTHRRWGKVYFWAMAVVAATAVALAVWRPVVFLALLAVFSFYNAFSGYRALSRKRPREGQGATRLDWTAALVTLAASAAMAVLGVVRPGPAWERVGVVPVVFGAFGMLLAGLDLSKFAWPRAAVVVRSHGRDARLLHRDGHGLLRRELHVPADRRPLALAGRHRHAADRRVDHVLQGALPAGRERGEERDRLGVRCSAWRRSRWRCAAVSWEAARPA